MSTIDEHGQPNRPRPGLPALESRLLADRLSAIPVEDYPLITYAELSAIARCNVQGKGRGYLGTARQMVLVEKGYVFRPQRNVGLRRMSSLEVSKGCSFERITHVRRTHKKGLKEQATVNIADLPDSERAGHVARMSLMAMTVYTHRGEQVKRLESAVNGSTQQLSLTKTLEAFKKPDAAGEGT